MTMPALKLSVSKCARGPVSAITLDDGDLAYTVGSADFPTIANDLARGRRRGGAALLQHLWRVSSSRVAHLCSSGTPWYDVKESRFDHFRSYGFGCCRERSLTLAEVLSAAGFSPRVLASEHHVALEVPCGGALYYVDPDAGVIVQGAIARLAGTKQLPFAYFGGVATVSTFVPSGGERRFELYPGESIEFTARQPGRNLVFAPMNGDDPFNIDGDDPLHKKATTWTGVGAARLLLEPRRAVECDTFHIESPFVLLGARLTGLPTRARVVVDGGTVPVPLLNTSFAAMDVIGEPVRGTLDPNEMLESWGGFARRVYLDHLVGHVYTDTTVPRPEAWKFVSFRLYENGRLLGPLVHGPDPGPRIHRLTPPNTHIVGLGRGRYRFYQDAHLVFSSSDGSDPKRNGRRYEFSVDSYPALWEARGRYSLRFSIEGVNRIPRDARIELSFQYNRGLMPDWSRARPTEDVAGLRCEVRSSTSPTALRRAA